MMMTIRALHHQRPTKVRRKRKPILKKICLATAMTRRTRREHPAVVEHSLAWRPLHQVATNIACTSAPLQLIAQKARTCSATKPEVLRHVADTVPRVGRPSGATGVGIGAAASVYTAVASLCTAAASDYTTRLRITPGPNLKILAAPDRA